jgi:hypothetical protein
MLKYKIIRFYRDNTPNEIRERGLSLEEAKEHCNKSNTRKEDKHGVVWFDRYTIE